MKYMRRTLFSLLFFIGLGILNIGLSIILVVVQQMLFVPSNYLLWTMNAPSYQVFFLVIGLLDTYLFMLLFVMMKTESFKLLDRLLTWIRSKKFILFSAILIAIYLMLPNVTSMTDEAIIHRSFYNPAGTEYAYEDVVRVETGVYTESKKFRNNKGEFYYKIYLKDHQMVDLNSSGGDSVNNRYRMIESIDLKLMKQGIEKIGSYEDVNLLYLDQDYIDQIKNIIEN